MTGSQSYTLRDLSMKDFRKKKQWIGKIAEDYEQQKKEQAEQEQAEKAAEDDLHSDQV